MNKLLVTLSLLLGFLVPAQVKRLYDPSIVAQEKRQVFQSWGDWRPYPKYFLSFQTNLGYATVWGMLAPKRNRRYKRGEDIRPLKLGGLETQRQELVHLQLKEAEKIKVEVDTLYKRNTQDFAHWTHLTASADPLWLLYYKRMLRPLQEFPDNPQSYIDWKMKNAQTYDILKRTGKIENLQRELDVLKDKLKQARTLDMPRGKRFLMYHECLLEWRIFLSALQEYGEGTTLLLDWKKNIDNYKLKPSQWKKRSDEEIVSEVINQYKLK